MFWDFNTDSDSGDVVNFTVVLVIHYLLNSLVFDGQVEEPYVTP